MEQLVIPSPLNTRVEAMMLRQVAALAATFSLTACELPASKEVETFGRTYDECILKNARDAGDVSSRQMAIGVCIRRFQRDATIVEKRPSIAVRRRLNRNVPNYEGGGLRDQLRVTVRNDQGTRIVTEVNVVAKFSDKAQLDSGQFPADARITTLNWTFPVLLEPNVEEDLYGSFEGERAPSGHLQSDAYVSKVVPFAERLR